MRGKEAGAGWEAMRAAWLPGVMRVAAAVHPAYPESEAVFAERLRLFPAGCLVLRDGPVVLGYAVAHPWHRRKPVPLDTALGALPARPGVLYLHDLALLPRARGLGAGAAAVARLAELARTLRPEMAREMRLELPAEPPGGLPLALVALGGTERFWRGQGFQAVADPSLEAVLRGYDPAARYMERPPGISRPGGTAR